MPCRYRSETLPGSPRLEGSERCHPVTAAITVQGSVCMGSVTSVHLSRDREQGSHREMRTTSETRHRQSEEIEEDNLNMLTLT